MENMKYLHNFTNIYHNDHIMIPKRSKLLVIL